MYPQGQINPVQQAMAQMAQYAQGINVNLAPFLSSQTGAMSQGQSAPQQSQGLTPEDQQALAQIQQAQGLTQAGSQNGQQGGVPMPDANQMQGGMPTDAQGQPMQQGIPTIPYQQQGQQEMIGDRPIYPGLTGGIDNNPPQYRP